MTKAERGRLLEAIRLLKTDDGYTQAMRILRVLAGGPVETALERAIRKAGSVSVSALFDKDQGEADVPMETCPRCGVTAPRHLPCPTGCGSEGKQEGEPPR